ncbi:hypothetical protein LWP59_10760 [Amycolatopsis acidiphila]|uniref:Uncharacterized protein n=1 Tax=Amycolatopsis acidiphila TaxID=715473 RepID=A0A557ZQQ8_9PSEU|nr:hypothetical protein [Amycolatopsis acidiphila]TVT14340.1 hypothetical protein FNH06_37860 [Amycolatopsis acidiphila]UIJ62064.1 hypothetical protein LWP59_10760 [Amycolatopsis acidiphila]GHG99468.1 hypothetical protein GCM10017788_80020 [Amycolatopsis acidiphila]
MYFATLRHIFKVTPDCVADIAAGIAAIQGERIAKSTGCAGDGWPALLADIFPGQIHARRAGEQLPSGLQRNPQDHGRLNQKARGSFRDGALLLAASMLLRRARRFGSRTAAFSAAQTR